MRDGIGSTAIITIIIVFIVLVSAYLAFNVNYTKAFRMKNKIIDLYNDYGGECGSSCMTKIKEYANNLGYKPASLDCASNGYTPLPSDYSNPLFCAKLKNINDKNGSDYNADGSIVQDQRRAKYYSIVTKINIEIPIVDNIIPLQVFTVSGNTKLF